MTIVTEERTIFDDKKRVIQIKSINFSISIASNIDSHYPKHLETGISV